MVKKEPKQTIATQLVVSHPLKHSNPINIAAQVGDSDFLIVQNACEAGKIKILQEVSNPICFPTLKNGKIFHHLIIMDWRYF